MNFFPINIKRCSFSSRDGKMVELMVGALSRLVRVPKVYPGNFILLTNFSEEMCTQHVSRAGKRAEGLLKAGPEFLLPCPSLFDQSG